MNYQKIYESIIEKSKYENRIKLRKNDLNYIYYEDHHIIPKCLSGTDDKSNKVLLTSKEHYICHKLLTYIYKGDSKIVYAFFRMTFDKQGKHFISGRNYTYAKELRSNTPMSKDQKDKLSKSHKGKITWMKGRHNTDKTKEKIIKFLTGKQQTKETINKRVQKIKGLKRKRINCIYCNKDFSISTHNRWHGENCKCK
jgi:hypothetical protein